MGGERSLDGRRFRLPGRRARSSDDSYVVEHDGRVLDEDTVGQLRCRRQPPHSCAEAFEHRLVHLVLGPCAGHVQWLALEVREFAIGKRRAHLARVGNQHRSGPAR